MAFNFMWNGNVYAGKTHGAYPVHVFVNLQALLEMEGTYSSPSTQRRHYAFVGTKSEIPPTKSPAILVLPVILIISITPSDVKFLNISQKPI